MTNAGESVTADIADTAAPTAGRLARAIGIGAVVLALLSAVATFLVLANLTPIVPTHNVVRSLLAFSGFTGLLLTAVIGREIWRVFQARRKGRAGSRLHVQIVGLFSVIAAVPAILVAVVASITVDRALDRLFSQPTYLLMQNSLGVAEAYVREHQLIIAADAIGARNEINNLRPLYEQNRNQFRQFITALSHVRGLPVVEIIDKDLGVVDRADVQIDQAFVKPSQEALASVDEDGPQVGIFLDDNYVAAVIKLAAYPNNYLYVVRLLDPRVVTQLRATREGVGQYAELQDRRFGTQIAFALMYTVIALIVLLSAAWIGLNFANYLVAPIRRLIGAAQIVSTGNLHVQVPTQNSEGDLAQLGQTFNKMTQELRTQRDDIVRARDVMDSRRRFTEAVLAGASAGVIGVNAEGQISILNRSAEKLIGQIETEALGRPLKDVVPELVELFTNARDGAQRLVQGQVTINRNGRDRNLSVRVTGEQSGDTHHGYVITLDDITELIAAQRTSAWADVARRIAHEIKNPLTPIQLSAERIRRKYGSVIKDDAAIFFQCTDTIVRQVDDIKRMVDEFSQFARMPKPVMGAEDMADMVRQSVFLQRVGNPDIDIEVDIADGPMPARFDRRLISQALTNIIKNAAEAIAAVPPETLGKGRIQVSAAREGDNIVVDVLDNGIGLPKENRSRLLEPYVTTREKGTGLGLAIVGRILEEHGGRIDLYDAAEKVPGQRGAWMRLIFAAAPVPVGAVQDAQHKTYQSNVLKPHVAAAS
ncbi:MAG TPA: PAS domain-containing sensor histidine kinase [Xanthobacteraceae bacterium]|jgi:two-component system nitrogen regulation sensor histidine kinase NtrY|nr:PAS domain-containing sensor histidine kinase [Xanthobacteraceae bacterium]